MRLKCVLRKKSRKKLMALRLICHCWLSNMKKTPALWLKSFVRKLKMRWMWFSLRMDTKSIIELLRKKEINTMKRY